MERQLLLLGILRAQKMHGYQLNEFLERHFDFITELKAPTAYYLLDKLAADGYVQTHQEQVGNRPQRRVYEITPRGEEHFFELLRISLRGHELPTYADEVGMAFMGELPSGEVAGYLAEKRATVAADLERLATIGARLGVNSGETASVRLVLDHHMAMVRAELDWLDALLKRMEVQ
jgi:DNA-binding PadR family transcriptional regulator